MVKVLEDYLKEYFLNMKNPIPEKGYDSLARSSVQFFYFLEEKFGKEGFFNTVEISVSNSGKPRYRISYVNNSGTTEVENLKLKFLELKFENFHHNFLESFNSLNEVFEREIINFFQRGKYELAFSLSINNYFNGDNYIPEHIDKDVATLIPYKPNPGFFIKKGNKTFVTHRNIHSKMLFFYGSQINEYLDLVEPTVHGSDLSLLENSKINKNSENKTIVGRIIKKN